MHSHAKKYDAWFKTPFGTYANRLEKRLVFRYLGPVMGKKILDLGCGTGNYSLELARRGATVTAIDPSREMLALAREKARIEKLEITLVKGEAEKMPFEKKSFDAIVSVTACEFFKDIEMAVDEMTRVLKPTGKIVIGVINKWSLYGLQKKLESKFKESVYRKAKFYSILELKKLFRVVRWDSTLFALPWMPEWMLTIFKKIDKPLAALLEPFGAFMVIEAKPKEK